MEKNKQTNWTHNIIYRLFIIELYNWILYNFINQIEARAWKFMQE